MVAIRSVLGVDHPAIVTVGVATKFDSTPTSGFTDTTVRSESEPSQPELPLGGPPPSGEVAAAEIDVQAKECHSFVQRVSVFRYVPDRGFVYNTIPCAPVPLATTSAKVMIKAVFYPQVVHQLMREANATLPGVLETMFIVLGLCLDGASSNHSLFWYTLAYYKAMNQSLDHSIITFCLLVLCQAHQVHISSLCCLANIGGEDSKSCQHYTRQLIGCLHTFGHNTHLVQIWSGLMRGLGSMRVVSAREARAAGIPCSTPEDDTHKTGLLTYLLCWVLNTRQLSKIYKDAVSTIVCYFNTTLAYWVDNDAPVRIHDHGPHVSLQQVSSALRTLLNRVAAIFSEGRWGTASPSYAYLAIWALPHNLSRLGMANGFSKVKLAERLKACTKSGGGLVDSKDGFVHQLTTRLSRAFMFVELSETCYRNTLAVFVNEPQQRSLFLTLRIDSRRNTDVAGFAARFAMGEDLGLYQCARGDPTSDTVTGASGELDESVGDSEFDEPPALVLAKGDKARKIMREAVTMFSRSSDGLTSHAVAFRHAFHRVGDPRRCDRIKHFWRCSMPGLGRLWYTFFFMWARWPFRLFLLVCSSVSEAVKDAIVESLLDVLTITDVFLC